MELRTIDKLGIQTSLLGFGCMRFPTTADGKIDEVRAQKMLDEAYAAGINYYDTAWPYHGGESEPFVGRAMKKYPRESFYFATKLPCWDVKVREDATRIFNEQLAHLQSDYVDFYLLHALNRDRFREIRDLGVIDDMVELQKQGKIRYLGFSFHDGYEAFEEILTYRDWDFCQIQYNYMDTDEQAGDKGYALCEERNVPIIKRIIAVGGDTVDIDFDKHEVYVNGELIDEPYIAQPTRLEYDVKFPITVEDGRVFVMGDNRNDSLDSRSSKIGTVDERYIFGKAIFRIVPAGEWKIY